ncbi:DUF3054 domain-containing protein [Natrarchaeobius oligotrophus]|uniref:DUF3054 domain-containing protein n=1 Tax=Natrarchaeobius chitinivorans TaxID=1679083 RepID=A0A3N6LZC8_NATCH|nr:DUF3054 domain-containing protein [Natrarchaeobius chitinivorans]RQG96253.1 DUF3054 domain-containing protein [Natrarchaeobius chitinivorans]
MDATVRTGSADAVVERSVLPLGVVDVALLVALIVVGQLSHGIDPISDPVASLETVAPFVLGWIVASLLAGVYTSKTSSSIGRTVRTISVTWLAAANVGFVLRTSPTVTGGTEWPFALVMTGFGLIVLVGWRVGYAAYVARDS